MIILDIDSIRFLASLTMAIDYARNEKIDVTVIVVHDLELLQELSKLFP